ncbi:PTS transporter subunit EIIC [Mycoplasma todarodis]|uniref:PTS transporter subunit EIIC n=1 Tax=Mycoplasma todarodis TaxID=1937191 RepID=UPI001B3248E8|nr:PTS transporter subunit EIIC [Mycoplasma todarodis]
MTFSLTKNSSQKKEKKVKVNNGKGGMKKFLSKVSGAFMLPISVMAIAGLFLGVGAAIASHAGTNHGLEVFGQFIQKLGDPVFSAMPILFAAAIAVAFTEEAGVAVFAAIVGYMTFSMLQTPFITEVNHGSGTFLADGKVSVKGAQNAKEVMIHDGWKVLFGGAGRSASAMDKLIGSNLGVSSLQTSVFGGILVGALTAWAYNKFHTIKLPNIISFFGGKRFVPLVVIILMIPLVFAFLIFWPWVGYGLAKFGEVSGKAPVGLDSFVFGLIERSLIPFGLHHVFYAPLWWSKAGGDFTQSLADWTAAGNKFADQAQLDALTKAVGTKAGDSSLWIAMSGLKFNTIDFINTKGDLHHLPVFVFMKDQLGLNLGRFMQGKFPFMILALPAAAAAMVMAAPKENRKMALGTILPAALTSFTTGVTEPLEFTFLFLAPALFWGFHAVMAGFAFMLMNVFGAHIGMTFSGGMIDMVIYGMLPVAKGTHFWWAFVIGAAYIPIYFLVFYFSIKKFNLETPGRGNNTKLFSKADFKNKGNGESQSDPIAEGIVAAYGGWDNITGTANCATRLRFDVKDASKVDEAGLKAVGAVGIMKTSANHVQAIFGPQAEQLHNAIKKLPKTTTAKVAEEAKEAPKAEEVKETPKVEEAKKATATKKPAAKKAPAKKATATKKPAAKLQLKKQLQLKNQLLKKLQLKKQLQLKNN